MEMLKALSAVSVDASLLRLTPLANPLLVVGVAVPFALHLAVLRAPRAAAMFGLVDLSAREWRIVAALALPVLLVEEALKAVGRFLQARTDRKEAVTAAP